MAESTYRPYRGKYIFVQADNGGDLYIHKRKRDIGLANDGTEMSDGEISKQFSKQKEQAVNAVKTHYQNMLLDNIVIEDNLKTLLNEAMSEDENLIDMIDKSIKKNMEQTINRYELQKLRRHHLHLLDLGQQLFTGTTAQKIKTFDSFLEGLAQTVRLIKSPAADLFAIVLAQEKIGKKKRSIKPSTIQLGTKIEHAIENFIIAIDDKPIKLPTDPNDPLLSSISALNTFANTLSLGTTTTKNSVTEKNMSDIIDSLFEQGFHEIVGSQLQSTANFNLDQALTTVTGHDTVKVERTDTKGKTIGFTTDAARFGKKDINLKNVYVKLDLPKQYSQFSELNMNIGISNKNYRTSAIFGGAASISRMQTGLSFDSGSGGSLREALHAIFETDFDRYLAYNTLARGTELNAATQALNTLILTRNINRLFATRGGAQDFASYILINGQIISIWDLITYVSDAKNQIGLSQSMQNNTRQGASIHIQGREKIISAREPEQARLRVPRVNNAVAQASISAMVHVDKLAQALF